MCFYSSLELFQLLFHIGEGRGTKHERQVQERAETREIGGTGKRENSGNSFKAEIPTMFLFSYLRTLSEDHVARLLVTHSLNLPILVQAGNTLLPECVVCTSPVEYQLTP